MESEAMQDKLYWPLHLGIVAAEKGALGAPWITVGQQKNSTYTTRQTEMETIQQTSHSKTDQHALILNSKKGTYTTPNNTKSQLYYILINQKWINSALNCETYSSLKEVSSDHRAITKGLL